MHTLGLGGISSNDCGEYDFDSDDLSARMNLHTREWQCRRQCEIDAATVNTKREEEEMKAAVRHWLSYGTMIISQHTAISILPMSPIVVPVTFARRKAIGYG